MCSYVENPLNRGLHPPPPPIPVYSIIFTLVGRLAPLFPSLLLLFLCHSSSMFRSRFTHFSLSILFFLQTHFLTLLPFFLFLFFFVFIFSKTKISSIVWQDNFLRFLRRNLANIPETLLGRRWWHRSSIGFKDDVSACTYTSNVIKVARFFLTTVTNRFNLLKLNILFNIFKYYFFRIL